MNLQTLFLPAILFIKLLRFCGPCEDSWEHIPFLYHHPSLSDTKHPLLIVLEYWFSQTSFHTVATCLLHASVHFSYVKWFPKPIAFRLKIFSLNCRRKFPSIRRVSRLTYSYNSNCSICYEDNTCTGFHLDIDSRDAKFWFWQIKDGQACSDTR